MNRISNIAGLMLLALTWVQPAMATTDGERFDPTRPYTATHPGTSANSGTDWQLNATHIAPGKRTVVINGVTLTEGGRLGAARVLAIEHGEALIDLNGKTRMLRLQPGEVKKNR